MSSTTPNFNLKKDSGSDNIGQTILDLSANMSIIDSEIQNRKNDLTTHKTAITLDHPDGSVTKAKLALKAVGTPQLDDQAVTLPKIDPTLLTNVAGNQNNVFAPNSYSWVATANQQTFTLPTNTLYTVGFIWVNVGGIDQTKDAFTATDGVSFTVAEPLTAGTKVDARWFQGQLASQAHHTSHYATGADPIDVTQLQNYSQNIGDVTTLSTTSKQVVGAINSNFNQIGSLLKSITNWINVTYSTYDVKADGTDQVAKINQAIVDANTQGIDTVLIPGGMGNVMVDATIGIQMKNNICLLIGLGTTIKAITNSVQTYNIINCHDIQNVKIIGGIIQGERTTHIGTGGEWGHGINIIGSNNVVIKDVVCRDCWGDGIYIGEGTQGYCDTVLLEDVTCDNNRRNGISLISGKNVKIVRPNLKNTNGTSPESGLDIEPNASTNILEHITVIEPYTENCANIGLSLALTNMSTSMSIIDIDIIGHRDSGSGIGQYVYLMNGGTGNINIEHPTLVNNAQQGFYARAYGSNSPRITVRNPTVINPNSSGQTSTRIGSGILITRESTDTGGLFPTTIGNIHIINPEVKDTRTTPLMQTGIFFGDNLSGQTVQNCSLIDPLSITGLLSTKLSFNVQNGVVSDKYNQTIKDLGNISSSIYTSDFRAFVHNGSSTGAVQSTLTAAIPAGWEITFEVRTANQLTVVPDASSWIRPLGSMVGKGVYSNQIGARLTLKRLDTTNWYIKEMIGTWTSQ